MRQSLLGAAALSALLGAAGEAAAQWQSYQADNQHSGRTDAAVNPLALSYAWSAPQGYSVPLMAGNTVFAMRDGGGSVPTSIRSFDLATGAVNWTFNQSFS